MVQQHSTTATPHSPAGTKLFETHRTCYSEEETMQSQQAAPAKFQQGLSPTQPLSSLPLQWTDHQNRLCSPPPQAPRFPLCTSPSSDLSIAGHLAP